MDVENELKQLLRTRDLATPVADPVAAIHAGIRRRRRNQRLQVLAAGASVLVVAVGGSLVVSDHLSAGRPAPAPITQPGPPPNEVPPGFRVKDVSFTSASDAYALGTAGCRAGTCTDLLVSRNAGRTWSGGPGPEGDVSHLRFSSTAAGAHVGYAFDPDLSMTLDGGLTWVTQPVPGRVFALEAARNSVIRVLSPQGFCPCTSFTIETAPLGSTAWRTVQAVTTKGTAVGVELTRQSNRLALLLRGHTAGGAEDAQSQLLLSNDNGATWSTHADPCGPLTASEVDATEVSLAPNGIVVALCQVRSGGQTSVAVSTDAGRTFARPRPTPLTASLLASPGGVLFVSANDTDRREHLLRSKDSGMTWSEVSSQASPSGPALLLGFTTDRTGTWIATDRRQLTRTFDGGQTWAFQPFR